VFGEPVQADTSEQRISTNFGNSTGCCDPEYRHTPSLGRYLYHLTMLIAEWERENQQHQLRTVGRSNAVVSTNKHQQSESGRATTAEDASLTCEGCVKLGHTRPSCRDKQHPDFNNNGLWIHSASRKAIVESFRMHGIEKENPTPSRYRRVDGTKYKPATHSFSTQSTTHPQGETTATITPPNPGRWTERGGRGRGNEGRDGRNNGGKNGRGH